MSIASARLLPDAIAAERAASDIIADVTIHPAPRADIAAQVRRYRRIGTAGHTLLDGIAILNRKRLIAPKAATTGQPAEPLPSALRYCRNNRHHPQT